jgi:hypothetical protein
LVLTFSNGEAADNHVCEKLADNPVSKGLEVSLQEDYCGTTAAASDIAVLFFKPTYAGSPVARFEGTTVQNAAVDASLATPPKPAGSCKMWSLTLDAVPVNLSEISHNPIALSVRLPDRSHGRVTVTNALIDQ